MGKSLQFICPQCANYSNGRITFTPKKDELAKPSLDGKIAKMIIMAPSKTHKCTECRQVTKIGWRWTNG